MQQRTRWLLGRALVLVLLFGVLSVALITQAQAPLTEIRMVFATGEQTLAMANVIDAYNAGRGQQDGVQVQMVLFGREGFTQRQETIMAAQSPEVDIFYTTSESLGREYTAFEPLIGYVPGFSEGSVFIRSTLNALSYEGILYGMPLDVDLQFLYYRADLIEQLLTDEAWQQRYQEITQAELGVAMLPKPVDQWIWEDYKATALFFTTQYNADSPTEYGTVIQANPSADSLVLWNNVLRSNGGRWLTDDGAFAFDTPAFRAAAAVYGDLLTSGAAPAASVNYGAAEATQAFADGQVAFFMQGVGAYPLLNAEGSASAGVVGIAPIPGPNPSTYITASGLALSKYSQNKQAAAAWLAYLTTPEALTIYAQGGGVPPVLNALETVRETRPELVIAAQHLEQFAYVETNSPYTGVILEVLGRNLGGYWSGELDLETAAKNAQNEAVAVSNQ